MTTAYVTFRYDAPRRTVVGEYLCKYMTTITNRGYIRVDDTGGAWKDDIQDYTRREKVVLVAPGDYDKPANRRLGYALGLAVLQNYTLGVAKLQILEKTSKYQTVAYRTLLPVEWVEAGVAADAQMPLILSRACLVKLLRYDPDYPAIKMQPDARCVHTEHVVPIGWTKGMSVRADTNLGLRLTKVDVELRFFPKQVYWPIAAVVKLRFAESDEKVAYALRAGFNDRASPSTIDFAMLDRILGWKEVFRTDFETTPVKYVVPKKNSPT